MDNICSRHDETMQKIDHLSELMRSSLTMQAKMDEQLATISKRLDNHDSQLTSINQCLAAIKLEMAQKYVTKDEFKKAGEDAENRIIRVHKRLDDWHENLAEYRKSEAERIDAEKGRTLKLLSAVFAGGALVFGIISWLVGLILL